MDSECESVNVRIGGMTVNATCQPGMIRHAAGIDPAALVAPAKPHTFPYLPPISAYSSEAPAREVTFHAHRRRRCYTCAFHCHPSYSRMVSLTARPGCASVKFGRALESNPISAARAKSNFRPGGENTTRCDVVSTIASRAFIADWTRGRRREESRIPMPIRETMS